VEQQESCPSCGTFGAPTTPEQLRECRTCSNTVSGKSLSRQFDRVTDVEHKWNDKNTGGGFRSEASGLKPHSNNSSVTAEEEYSTVIGRASSAHDLEEPILMDSDERFCLLPIK
jgi:hypothetical protein